MAYRESPDEVLRRHAALKARLDELQPKISALRTFEAEARSIQKIIDAEERRLTLPILENLRVASPCRESWEEMSGDERVRFCRRCEKNVYNLSSMTRPEAEALVFEREGAVCVRFYRREDGTVLTSDCPPGRRRMRVRRSVFAGLLGVVLAVLGLRREPTCDTSAVKVPALDLTFQGIVKMRDSDATTGIASVLPPETGSRFTGFEILDRKLGD